METLANRYADLLKRIAVAERRFGRRPGSVKLLAVAKTRPVEAVAALAALGHRYIGENYLQEAAEKIRALSSYGLEWHFIGPVQSNKTRAIAAQFDWVHTLDREKIARRLHEHRPDALPPLNVCIQVNVSEEPSKSGVGAAEIDTLADLVADLPRLRLRGLMALPAESSDFAVQVSAFRRVCELRDRLGERVRGLDTLSLGTTQDLEAAVAQGATIVRIGTGLFGERK